MNELKDETSICPACGRNTDPLLAHVLGIVGNHVLTFCSNSCKEDYMQSSGSKDGLSPRCLKMSPLPSLSPSPSTVPPAVNVEPGVSGIGVEPIQAARKKFFGMNAVLILIVVGLAAVGITAGVFLRSGAERRSAEKSHHDVDEEVNRGDESHAEDLEQYEDYEDNEIGDVIDQEDELDELQQEKTTGHDQSEESLPVPDDINKRTVEKKYFRFVVWPDTHVRLGKNGVTAPTRAMLSSVLHNIRPDFVIHTGDMISIRQKKSENGNAEAMWRVFYSAIHYPLLKAGIPFFPTAGNHDVYNARGVYRDYWRKRKNLGFQVSGPEGYAGYYSFRYGDAHFVSLYAPGTRSLPDRWNQMAWLREDLKKAREKNLTPIFVFSHSPLFCPKMDRRCDEDRGWLDDDELSKLLAKHKVTFLSGHMHIYHDTVYRGIRTFITGMVGGGRRRLGSTDDFQPYQFMTIDVKGKEFRVYRVKYPNMDTSHIPPNP